jgi:hypothetical protein
MERVLIRGEVHWLQVDEVLVSSEGGRGNICRERILILGEV